MIQLLDGRGPGCLPKVGKGLVIVTAERCGFIAETVLFGYLFIVFLAPCKADNLPIINNQIMTVRTMSLLFLTMLTFVARSQNFEGKMVSRITIKSKIPGLPDERLSNMLGLSQDYFIKGGKYKSLSNGQMITMQIYDPTTNKLYNKRPNSDTLYWMDAGENEDEVTSYEIKKNAETILGNLCDALILTTKTGTTIYYYSSKYRLDKAKFANHNFGNWSFLAAKAGALPLKSVIENKQFRLEMTATEITPMALTDAMFAIPSNAPVKMGM